jgi:acyl-CoA dehydrogenase
VAEVARIAGLHAADVDRDATLPADAIAAMKRHGLLGAMVPASLGGADATLGDLAAIACTLGRACSATAMIYAMHQIQLASLVAHGGGSAWHRGFMQRVADEQLLLASVTSEVGVGGDIRQSRCAVASTGEGFTLRKESTAISYGRAADALLITARRHAEAAPSDQVLVVAPRAAVRMERTGGWNPMGMRGTCTEAFVVQTAGHTDQIMPAPFGDISAATMLPVSHVLWSALWLGIAADALDRARAFLRAGLRKSGGALPPGAARLVDAVASLQLVQAQLRRWLDRLDIQIPAPLSLSDSAEMNNLKIQASETCLRVVQEAMLICGFAGYQNDSPFSLSRHLRDLQSAPLMVNNDRIRASTASLLLGPKLNLGIG